MLKKHSKYYKIPKIWAKIETKEGIENFDSIVEQVDGVMFGRGDLSAELGVYEIPRFQSELLKKAKNNDKTFIIATYVLETMRFNQSPSVAECNDIYNSLEQNVSGFMLAAEVGIGKHPVLVVKSLKNMINSYYSLNDHKKEIVKKELAQNTTESDKKIVKKAVKKNIKELATGKNIRPVKNIKPTKSPMTSLIKSKKVKSKKV